MARTTHAGRIAGAVALVVAFAAQGQSRGELLYSTHCIACHTTKMHWRDARAATDWASIVVQVRKWESANSLSWNEQDVVAVARYLNETFYHFDQPQPRADARPALRAGESLRDRSRIERHAVGG